MNVTNRLVVVVVSLLSIESPAVARSGSRIETLDKVVESAVRSNYEALHGCFRKALAVDRKRGGTLFVRVTMGGGDAIKAAKVERDELGHRGAVRCILGWVRGWTLHGARAAGAGPGSEITIPLSFRASPGQFAVHVEDVAAVPFGQGRVRVLLSAGNTGARKASLVQIKLKGKVRLPGRAGVDQGVLVVAGKGWIEHHAPGKRRRSRLRSRTAAWIPPEAEVALEGQLEALLVFAPGGIEGSFTEKGSPAPGDRPLRPVVVQAAKVRPVKGKGKTWPLLTAQRLRHRRIHVDLLEIGSTTPVERRVGSGAEILYILEGRAEATLGGLRRSVRAGDAIYLPAGDPLALRVGQKLTAWRVLVPGPRSSVKRIVGR